MNIGFDFDGVIANSPSLRAFVAREIFGVNIKPEFFTRELVVNNGILTEEQYRYIGVKVIEGLYPIPPVVDALFYLNILLNKNHSIRIITSRTENMLGVAKKWLINNKINLPIQGVGYGISKASVCEKLKLDLYVDDHLTQLLPLICKVKHPLFFSWPWNNDKKEPKEVKRVSSWWEIYNFIRYET